MLILLNAVTLHTSNAICMTVSIYASDTFFISGDYRMYILSFALIHMHVGIDQYTVLNKTVK